MNIDQAKDFLEEIYGVDVQINKDPVFSGYNVVFAYPFYLKDEKHFKFKRFNEIPEEVDWEQWQKEMNNIIIEDLNIL